MLKLNKELVSGSIILLIAFNLFAFFNFVYHFSMARLMSLEEYGSLAALFSLIYIFTIFSDSIQTLLAKYSSNEKNNGKLKNLFKRTFKKAILLFVILFLLFLLIAIILSNIWSIKYYLIALTGLVIGSSFLSPIGRGIMQGRKRFKQLGANLIVESLLKLLLAIALVVVGAKVFGAIIAVVFATFVAMFLSLWQIKDIIKAKEIKIKTSAIYKQAIAVFIIMLSVTLFYSMDVIVAKAIFDDKTAGFYAIASILGKIIFWGTQPISRAMLPIASEKNKKKLKSVFWSSFAILGFLTLVALIVFYLFPELIVKIFSGKDINESSSILFNVGIGMALIAYANLILVYKIASMKSVAYSKFADYKKLFVSAAFLGLALLAELLILLSSGGSLLVFSKGFIISSGIFFIISLILSRMRE